MQMKNMIAKWWRKFISSNWNSVSLLTLLTKMQNNWKLTANSNCKPNCCKNQECYQPYAVSCCPTHFRALEIWIILILFACVFTIRNAISSFGFYDWKKNSLCLGNPRTKTLIYIDWTYHVSYFLLKIGYMRRFHSNPFCKVLFPYYLTNWNLQFYTMMFLTRQTTIMTNHDKLKWFAFNKEANAFRTMLSICFENVLRTYCVHSLIHVHRQHFILSVRRSSACVSANDGWIIKKKQKYKTSNCAHKQAERSFPLKTHSVCFNTIFVSRRLFHPTSVLQTYTADRFGVSGMKCIRTLYA